MKRPPHHRAPWAWLRDEAEFERRRGRAAYPGMGTMLLMGAGTGSPFTPASLPGLIRDFQSTVSGTTFQDAALTTPATANNAPVGGWKDLSVTADNATQGTNADRPTLSTGQRNGKPALQGGASLNLACGSNLSVTNHSIFAWINVNGSTQFLLDRTANITSVIQLFSSSGTWTYQIRSSIGGDFKSATFASLSTGAWHSVAATFDGAHMTPYVDGVAGTPVAETLAGSITLTPLLFSEQGGTNTFLGLCDTLLIYNTALTAPQVLQLHNNT